MYAILKEIDLTDIGLLYYASQLFHSGEETGHPHLFDDEMEASEYQEEHQLNGKVVELPYVI